MTKHESDVSDDTDDSMDEGDCYRVLEPCAETDRIVNEGLRLGYIEEVWLDDDGALNFQVTEAGARAIRDAWLSDDHE